MMRVCIVDGYVDEPTCLGVPPYISPYPRYIAGAIQTVDNTNHVTYLTIDQLRTNPHTNDTLASADLVVCVAGMAVPGKYLSGHPASPNEFIALLQHLEKPVKLLCGPAARYGFGLSGGKHVRDPTSVQDVFDLIVPGDGELVVAELLKNHLNVDRVDASLCRSHADDIARFSTTGSQIVTQHPFYPSYLITEIETYRGCSRSVTGGCSFCSEPSKGPPQFRPINDIVNEIQALYKQGIRHVRIGNQPCLFSYMAHDAGREEFPRPNPEAIEKLFKGIRSIAPDLQTLHIDNANPGVIAKYPSESRIIAKTIVKYHTSGDIAALGVESVDPVVIKKNNLKASADDVMTAIILLNKVGSSRGANGLPELLPGLNFVFGLDGETKETFRLNFEFLQRIVENNLLVRRINLRQVLPIPGTRMSRIGTKNVMKHKQEFHRFKIHVREHIEYPLLQKLVPVGTVMTNVYTELLEGKLTFGRQLGTYPLLVGIPGRFPLHHFFNVALVDHGYRSVTAVPYPLDVNTASRETLEALPGVGKKRVNRILRNRPFRNQDHFIQAFDDPFVAHCVLPFISLNNK